MAALYIILGWLILGVLVWIIFYFRPSARMTSDATATVISAEEREIRNESRRWDETLIVCTFHTQGKDYQLSQKLPGKKAQKYAPGKRVAVQYNPANPAMARIRF